LDATLDFLLFWVRISYNSCIFLSVVRKLWLLLQRTILIHGFLYGKFPPTFKLGRRGSLAKCMARCSAVIQVPIQHGHTSWAHSVQQSPTISFFISFVKLLTLRPLLAYSASLGWQWRWLWRSRWNGDWQGKPKFSEKTCPSATFNHHKIPHDQTRVWTRAAAVGSRRLTAWAMARPRPTISYREATERSCMCGGDEGAGGFIFLPTAAFPSRLLLAYVNKTTTLVTIEL
jgi:hypothetical protein